MLSNWLTKQPTRGTRRHIADSEDLKQEAADMRALTVSQDSTGQLRSAGPWAYGNFAKAACTIEGPAHLGPGGRKSSGRKSWGENMDPQEIPLESLSLLGSPRMPVGADDPGSDSFPEGRTSAGAKRSKNGL